MSTDCEEVVGVKIDVHNVRFTHHATNILNQCLHLDIVTVHDTSLL